MSKEITITMTKEEFEIINDAFNMAQDEVDYEFEIEENNSQKVIEPIDDKEDGLVNIEFKT